MEISGIDEVIGSCGSLGSSTKVEQTSVVSAALTGCMHVA